MLKFLKNISIRSSLLFAPFRLRLRGASRGVKLRVARFCVVVVCGIACNIVCGALSASAQRISSWYPLDPVGQIDSLQRSLRELPAGREKAEALNNLGYALRFRNSQQAFASARQALRIADSLGLPLEQASAWRVYGFYYRIANRYDSALVYFYRAFHLAQELNERELTVDIANDIGNAYRAQGENDSALAWLRGALERYRAMNNVRGEADALFNIGLLYRRQGKYDRTADLYRQARALTSKFYDPMFETQIYYGIGDVYLNMARLDENPAVLSKAIEHFREALRVQSALGNDEGMGQSYFGMGQAFKYMRQFDSALCYYDSALAVAAPKQMSHIELNALWSMGHLHEEAGLRKEAALYYKRQYSRATIAGRPDQAIGALSGIGRLFQLERRYDSAEVWYLRAFEIAEHINDRQYQATMLYNLADLDIACKRWSKAQQRLKEGVKICEQALLPHLHIDFCNGMYRVAKARNDARDALAWHERLLALKDSLAGQEKSEYIMELQARFDAEWQEEKIRNLQRDNELSVQKAGFFQRERNYAVAFGITAVVVMGVLGGLYRRLKKSRALLLQQTQILEGQSQEIHRANEELLRANERLREANEFKMTALSVVSHDLKNPLNAMIGMASIIEHLAPSAEETVRAAASIRQTGERMTNLINELLDNAALEAGGSAAAMETCNIGAVLEEILPEHQEAAAAKGQKIVWDIAERARCITRGDEVLLGQAFANVLSNAVKYSPFNAVIRVSARVEVPARARADSTEDAQQNLRVVVSVEDDGPGFTREDKQKLFTPFQRLSARPTGGESSHGAGLAISKQIIDRHNGEIWVESEPESGKKGSVVVISLPCRSSA